jgi:hypothetical protein
MRWRKANQNKRRSLYPNPLPPAWIPPEQDRLYMVVSLCCRDTQGNFEDKAYKISIGEFEMELHFMEGVDLLYLDHDKNVSWYPAYIKIIDRIFPVRSCRQYYGNLLWDGVEMNPEDVIDLLNYLMSEGFTPECAPTEIFDAFDRGEQLSVKHIPDLMDADGDWDYHNFMR